MHVCREGGGGLFYVVDFSNAIFSNSELNTKQFFCQTNIIWMNIFIDNIYNAREYFQSSILKINQCTSKRTQLQQSLEMSVYFVFLGSFCLLALMFCAIVNIFAVMTRRFPVHLGLGHYNVLPVNLLKIAIL